MRVVVPAVIVAVRVVIVAVRVVTVLVVVRVVTMIVVVVALRTVIVIVVAMRMPVSVIGRMRLRRRGPAQPNRGAGAAHDATGREGCSAVVVVVGTGVGHVENIHTTCRVGDP